MKQLLKVYETNAESKAFEFCEQYPEKTFILNCTGYTTKLTELGNKNYSYLFAEKFFKFDFFAMVKKLKKEIDDSNIIIDEIPKESLIYFAANPHNLKNGDYIFYNEIYNIDITSCYLNVLFLEGFISENLFNEINLIDKELRLKLIGALATTKTNFIIKNNTILEMNQTFEENYKNVFLYLCYVTGNLMAEIAAITGNDLLFFWVDGLYFKKKDAAEKAEKYLKEKKYKSKYSIYNNFTMKLNNNIFATEFYNSNFEKKTFQFNINHQNKNLINILKNYSYDNKCC